MQFNIENDPHQTINFAEKKDRNPRPWTSTGRSVDGSTNEPFIERRPIRGSHSRGRGTTR